MLYKYFTEKLIGLNERHRQFNVLYETTDRHNLFFLSPITNSFTKGCNNKIKVLKRNAYDYHNFKRFRNCILHIFSHQTINQATVS